MSLWTLALDTSTEACSVALGDGTQTLFRYTDEPRKHAEQALAMVAELMAEAELTSENIAYIAFGRGPGAFTGLRIAAAVVQGLAFAWDVPVKPISSLRALAQRGYREQGWLQIFPAIDARMNEVYWGQYHVIDGVARPCLEDCLTGPEQLQEALNVANQQQVNWAAVGTGFGAPLQQATITAQHCDTNLLTHAVDVLTVALAASIAPVSAWDARPVYLRNNIVQR